ncbi:MAG TPA: diacylglycerol kinase family protein [Pirellulales bacterium]|jgi:diacylglycerol kinase|nr:diacylglycerol kinase family protein [Pirellulales bacterium]
MNPSLDKETIAEHYERASRRGLAAKFGSAFRGLSRGIRGESNFFFHLFAAAVTIAASMVFKISAVEWCFVIVSITAVFAAEMFNTAIESLAQAVSRQYNPRIADALDIAAGAVSLVGLGAAIVGAVIFIPRLWPLFGW